MSVVKQVLANLVYDGKVKVVDYDRASVTVKDQVKKIVNASPTPRRRPPVASVPLKQNLTPRLPEIEAPKPVPIKELKMPNIYDDFTIQDAPAVVKRKRPTVAKAAEPEPEAKPAPEPAPKPVSQLKKRPTIAKPVEDKLGTQRINELKNFTKAIPNASYRDYRIRPQQLLLEDIPKKEEEIKLLNASETNTEIGRAHV